MSSPAFTPAGSPRSHPNDLDQHEGHLTASYGGRRRKLLDILNDLRNLGIQSEIDLPQIAVLGSQSAGKSSLIESMSGINLPRASGTCTRCPMECHLQAADSPWSCTVSLRFDYDQNDRRYTTPRIVKFGPKLSDKVAVKAVLERAQRAILHPWINSTDFLIDDDVSSDRPPLTFSKNCVCIRVEGRNVPDLLFYDLPGIIANVAEGGDPRDINLIRELAQSYIKKPNCIILLVTSCETDFENQGAGSLVLRNGKLKKRTVGVLTKVDRIPEDEGDKWAAILQGRSNALPHGWFGVKMPDSAQMRNGVTWEDARLGEKVFFRDNLPWCELPQNDRDRLGSGALAEYLGCILSDMVSSKLPDILAIVQANRKLVDAELLEYPVQKFDDPDDEVHRRIRKFLKEVEQHVRGLALASSNVNTTDPFRAGLIQTLHGSYDDFCLEVHRTAPQFRPWESGVTPQADWVTQASKYDAATGQVGDVHHIDGIMTLAKKSRTRELPGIYPFSVRVVLIQEAMQSWGKLASNFFSDVNFILANHLDRLMQTHFGSFEHGGLLDAVRLAVLGEVKSRFELTDQNIRAACDAENEPWTQNDEFYFAERNKFLSLYRVVYRSSTGSETTLFDNNRSNQSTVNDIISYLAQLGVHPVDRRDLAKLLPSSPLDPALDIMAEVRAYFQVAYKRFMDEIPNQIDAAFIRPLGDDLDLALTRMTRKATSAQCQAWLEESPGRIRKRTELKERKERLDLVNAKLMPVIRDMAQRGGGSDDAGTSPPSGTSSPHSPRMS